MIIEGALNIYTDGSSFSGPRRGGIGIRFITVDNGATENIYDIQQAGHKGATNNQMELYACVMALEEAQKHYDLSKYSKIIINLDSLYVADNYNNAFFSWSRNKWRNRDGRPIENAKIWKDLLKCISNIRKRVEFKWVRGHSTDIHNKAVDKLAKLSAQNAFHNPLTHVSVRRKKTKESVKIGSVKMQGQRLLIHVITTQNLRIPKVYKYKYEVLSEKSEYFGKVDLIFSTLLLRDGHCYIISLNKNTRNPLIVKVLTEIDCKTRERIAI